MGNVSDYLFHEETSGLMDQLASIGPIANVNYLGGGVVEYHSKEELEKAKAEANERAEKREKEYMRRRRSSVIVELAEKILINCPDIDAEGAFAAAKDFFRRAEDHMKFFEADKA